MMGYAADPWTDADDTDLRAGREAGTPFKDIAKALGRTEAAVWNRWRRKGFAASCNGPSRKRTYENIGVTTQPDSTDSSTPKFANHEKHLRLLAEAMCRGEHLPARRAA